AVHHVAAALIPRPQHKAPLDSSADVVLFERQLHALVVCSATSKAPIRRIGLQSDCVAQRSPSRLKPAPPCFVPPGARLAAACASPRAANPPRSSPRGRFAFRPALQIPDAGCSAVAPARRSIVPERTARPALSRESAARSRRTPAAAPTTDTSLLQAASTG